MGIRLLNTFLNAQNVDGLKKNQHFSFLKRKTICVDISIYLYKFKQQGINNIDYNTGKIIMNLHEELLKGIERMINTLRKYQCELIFVFDGKPPDDKQNTIDERQSIKQAAQSKKNIYTRMLLQRKDQLNQLEKKSLCEKIIDETKKSISITNYDIRAVKKLLEDMRVKYIQCEGEADRECLRLVKKGDAWAVMSDDTDFIAQCSKRVIRNVDFVNERYDFITIKILLLSLYLNAHDFKYICVLAGCDYYKSDTKLNIFKIYDYYKKFCNYKHKYGKRDTFIIWLSKYIDINVDEISGIVECHMT